MTHNAAKHSLQDLRSSSNRTLLKTIKPRSLQWRAVMLTRCSTVQRDRTSSQLLPKGSDCLPYVTHASYTFCSAPP